MADSMKRITNAYGANSPTVIEPSIHAMNLLNKLEEAAQKAWEVGWNEDDIYAAIRRGLGYK